MSRSDVQSEVRVILVGRTGLDAALRLDESFELARVRTPHDAIGELATPLDDETPEPTAVVVAPEIESDLLDPPALQSSTGALPGRQRLVDFIRALRLVQPTARVLCVESGPDGVATARRARDLFDGMVRVTQPIADIRSVMGLLRQRVEVPSTSVMPRVDAAPSVPTRDEGSVASQARPVEHSVIVPDPAAILQDPPSDQVEQGGVDAGLGDQALVEVAVKGHDITSVAMRVLRDRIGDPGLAFVPPPAGKAGGAPQGVPVVWSDAVLGYLVPSRAITTDLTTHARWLAGWLRLRDQHNQLKHAAFTDPLTSAWNRRYLDRFLAGAIDAARGQRWSVTVLMFDIDDFKKYNDEYGHDAGDEILSEVVRLLRSVTRPTDKVCRIGGDEFAVVFHEPEGPRSPDSKHPTTVHAITRRFQQQVIGHKFPKLSGCAPGTLTISGGLATFPWDGQTPAELLARADERAMESKRQGKNAITIGPGAILKCQDELCDRTDPQA